MTRLAIALLLSILWAETYAQIPEMISSDRPGQAYGPLTVGKKVFQFQTGIEYGESWVGTRTNPLDYRSWVLTLRYGISENFEISGDIGYMDALVEKTDFLWRTTTFRESNIQNTAIRFRYSLHEGSGWIPSVATHFQLTKGLPQAKEPFWDNIDPTMILVTSQDVTNSVSFTTNNQLYWTHDGQSSMIAWAYVANVGVSITDKLGMFGECYGNVSRNDWQVRFDGGFSYLPTKDIQLDLFGGLNEGAEGTSGAGVRDFFVSVGCSWRFLPKSAKQISE